MSSTRSKKILSALIVAIFLTSLSLLFFQQASTVEAQLPSGIPRSEVFVSTTTISAASDPNDMNGWVAGQSNLESAIVYEPLWTENITGQTYIPLLASGLPVYSNDYTTLTINLRQGIYWSDGTPFTANDIVFTVNLELNNSGLTSHAFLTNWVSSISAPNNYTVVVNLKKSDPLFYLSSSFPLIMPEHIWANVNPLTFQNDPPIGTGAYALISYDPNGNWALFKLRTDWDRSATGLVFGKPQPLYLLYEFYQPTNPNLVVAIKNNQIDYGETTTDLLSTVEANNPKISTFSDQFPFTWNNGLYDISAGFNNAEYPYNITNVRWALALAINITETNINAYQGNGRIATFQALSKPYLEPYYQSTLLPWIENLTLSDGYQPFNDAVQTKLASYAKSQGYTYTTDISSPGWWNYDPTEATKLLEANGFTKNSQGQWLLPDGKLWTIDIVGESEDPTQLRLLLAVANEWEKFGINLNVETLTTPVYTSRTDLGEFDVAIGANFGAQYYDVWLYWQVYSQRYLEPTGTMDVNAPIRWNDTQFSNLLNQLAALPPSNPNVISLGSQLTEISLQQLPVINLFVATRMFVRDNTYWTNYPTAQNDYWEEGGPGLEGYSPILEGIRSTGSGSGTTISINPGSNITQTVTATSQKASFLSNSTNVLIVIAVPVALVIIIALLVVRRNKAKKLKSFVKSTVQ